METLCLKEVLHPSDHQVTGVQALAKVMGWQVLASSCFLGSGAVEPFGSAAGCLLANNKGNEGNRIWLVDKKSRNFLELTSIS